MTDIYIGEDSIVYYEDDEQNCVATGDCDDVIEVINSNEASK